MIYLARSIRNKNKVKNRQPLSTLKVILSDKKDNAVVESFKDIIAEELKNFNEIRNRYPDNIPNIIKAVKTNKFKLTADGAVLEINGEEKTFDSEIILVTYHAKEGQHVSSDKGIVVSLDLTITDELRDEGFVRDIVRSIQDTRRKMDCEITDNILLELKGDYPTAWTDYICNETLSKIAIINNPGESYEIEYDDGRKVNISTKKM